VSPDRGTFTNKWASIKY